MKNFSYAGRTDRGVHAKGQIVSFEDSGDLPLNTIKNVINKSSENIQVVDIRQSNTVFNPRRSAIGRTYEYWLYTGHKHLFLDSYMLYVDELDINIMRLALNHFVGNIFCERICKPDKDKEQNLNRVVSSATVDESSYFFLGYNGMAYKIVISANSFLRHMIRKIVSLLLAVNSGQIKCEDIPLILTGELEFRGKMAPAKALFLAEVHYANC